MTIDWRSYDAFDWQQAKQSPLDAVQRANVEHFVADVLELSAADRAGSWGAASPPGRFAASVIRVHPSVRHRFVSETESARIATIAVKVFKTNRDATREARRLIEFHNHERDQLPGLPHDHLQRVHCAGSQIDAAGESRAYVVQEWIAGTPLDELLRDPRQTQITAAQAKSIIHQLLAVITAPLWSLGTIWWDFRDANYCYDRSNDKLTMIDVDSLAAYADEILRHPVDWTRRDKGRQTALARLRQMTLRIVLATGCPNRKHTETLLHTLWQAEISPTFSRLGHDGTAAEAGARVQHFVERLFDQ